MNQLTKVEKVFEGKALTAFPDEPRNPNKYEIHVQKVGEKAWEVWVIEVNRENPLGCFSSESLLEALHRASSLLDSIENGES